MAELTAALKEARAKPLFPLVKRASDRTDIAFLCANPRRKNKITLPKLKFMGED